MADKVLTVSEQTHALVNAWCERNGMKQDSVVRRAMQALDQMPNGLWRPGESDEPAQKPDS